jgi:RND family efflux transporter MFP subunit
VVLKKYFEAGSLVGPTAPLVTIGSIGQLKLQVSAEEKLLGYLKTGETISFTVDAWPNQTFSGRISNIQPQIDPATRTIPVEITVSNNGQKLFPGMFAKATITRQAANNVLAIPAEAVLEDSHKYVFIVENGKAVKRTVTTGLADDNYIEITSGLSEGDRVIIAGQSSVLPGSPVEIVGGTQ